MNSSSRISEVDLLRVAALILMVLYHFVYDLDTFTPASVNSKTLPWMLVGKSAAFLFIFLSGICSNLSRHPLHNGITLLFWAFLITFITYIAFRETFVRFGILHFLGCMLLLYPIFKNRSKICLILLTFIAIILGIFFKNIFGIGAWLLPFGITYRGFTSIDYFPIFPYSGIFILGILFYRFRYAAIQNSNSYSLPPIIEKMSRNSLPIYILHQPILLSILFIIQRTRA